MEEWGNLFSRVLKYNYSLHPFYIQPLILYCFRYEKSGNQDLAENLAQWVFKERGVLRVGEITHHKKGDKKPPVAYTITDNVVSILI